jgi:GH3 auxin-responsive promoter
MPNSLRRGVRSVLRFLLRNVVGKLVAVPIGRRLAQFEAATHRPRDVQEALLRDILAHQKGTAFGRDHRFDAIRTIADYRRQVPIAGYEYVEPYMARVLRGETSALLADARIHMFALTSGTTATRKYIPVTDQYLADYKRGWNLWGLKTYRDHREVVLRPIVQMSGDWAETRTETGVPCGAVTGLTASMQKRVVRWMYCVPASVGRIKDAAVKYYVALRLSLPQKAGMVIAANPSTLINMARTGDQEKESLLRDLADGTLDPRLDLPADVREAIRPRLEQHPERVRELEAIIARTGTLLPRDYWAPHCLLGNWTGGSMGAFLRHYPRYFGDLPVRDVGLIASEGRMTIPLADGTPSGVLDVTSHYFEFIPEEEMESPQPTVLGADELREGCNYYILPTTSYGLYRYDIHDVVRVTGFHNRTPLIEFLSKGAHFSSVTGEKLSEYHVTRSMVGALDELDLMLTSYTLAPCWEGETPYYGLFVERGDLADEAAGRRLAERLDALLKECNIEYASKRDSLRLGAVRLEPLEAGAWREWDRARLKRTGGTLEQYKHPCLIADPGFHAEMTKKREAAPASS